MISIRRFEYGDAPVLRQKQSPNLSEEDIRELIGAWNTGHYEGKRFWMFALIRGGSIVGSVSLYERSKSVVSAGVEVFEGERGRGYGTDGLRLMIEKARELGFRAMLDQVSADNGPSKIMHEKLGFETDGYIYKNAKHRDVLIYLLCL